MYPPKSRFILLYYNFDHNYISLHIFFVFAFLLNRSIQPVAGGQGQEIAPHPPSSTASPTSSTTTSTPSPYSPKEVLVTEELLRTVLGRYGQVIDVTIKSSDVSLMVSI